MNYLQLIYDLQILGYSISILELQSFNCKYNTINEWKKLGGAKRYFSRESGKCVRRLGEGETKKVIGGYN